MDRRSLLRGALAVGGVAALPPLLGRMSPREATARAAAAGITFDPAPFTLGVASGDPLADSVILWTRLAPSPLTDGEDPRASGLPAMVEVDWVVAADPRLRRVVRSGTAVAAPDLGFGVHVDVDGLEPGTTYWYRFAALGRVSRIGRTRTAPVGPTAEVRAAWVSCSNLPVGSFAAYRRLATEDLDIVFHLGDYIYENPGSGDGRGDVGGETVTLADYRNRHAVYKGDPALRAAHAAFPWAFTWDDHEVDNNYAGQIPENENAEEGNDSRERFALRRSSAYRAYYEHLPLRLTDAGPPAATPSTEDLRIYKRLAYGDLVEVFVLDTRQYRDDQPCGDFDAAFRVMCDEVDDPARTMLGGEQKAWLLDGLSSSPAAWRLLLSSVMVAPWQVRQGLPDDIDEAVFDGVVPIDDRQSVNADQWDGYTAERTELLRSLESGSIEDVVVIVGDLHSTWVTDLRTDYDDPGSPTVGTEFVGTSVSSSFPIEDNPAFDAFTLATNPHVRYFDPSNRGYQLLRFTPDALDVTFRVLDGKGADPRAAASNAAAFRVARGTPGAMRTS